MNLNEAAAFYKLGLLDNKKLKEEASKWLDDLTYSDILFEAYDDPFFIENNSVPFENLLKE